MSKFWNQADLEPKRNFKWEMSIQGGEHSIAEYIAKSSGKPSPSIETAEHKYFNDTFKYPGSVTWEPIEIVVVDPISINATGRLLEIIRASGYNLPTAPQAAKVTISKAKAVQALGGDIKLRQLDSNADKVDEFRLVNAWVSNVDFSDFSYDDDELSEVTMEFQYDFAEFEGATGDDGGETFNNGNEI